MSHADPAIKTTVRKAGVKAMLFVFLPFAALYVAAYLPSLLSPPDSFIADITGYGWLIIVPLAVLPVFITLGLMRKSGLLAANRAAIDAEFAVRWHRLGNLCLYFLAATLAAIAYGASCYSFYLTPQKLAVGAGLFSRSHHYEWGDVTRIDETCSVQEGRYQPPRIFYLLTVTLNDGRTVTVAPNESVVAMASFIKDDLMKRPGSYHISYAYDTNQSRYCPAGFSVALPRNQEIVSAYSLDR